MEAFIGTLAPHSGHSFFASTDERFRPVYAYVGPLGELYVVDMHKGILQHKAYMTAYLKRLVSSLAAFQLADLVSKLLAVLLLPVYTRYISPSGYGVVELLANGVILISILVRLGMIALAVVAVRLVNTIERRSQPKVASMIRSPRLVDRMIHRLWRMSISPAAMSTVAFTRLKLGGKLQPRPRKLGFG